MRNRKDLFLDFTSLLDIVLLLLFFFIMSNSKHTSNAVNAAEQSQKHYEQLAEQQSELNAQLQNEIQIVDQVTPQEMEEIIDFNRGDNLKLLLKYEGDIEEPLSLTAVLGKEAIGQCLVTDNEDAEEYQEKDVSAALIAEWLSKSGKDADSVIMCEFIYDGDMPRTSEACDKIISVFSTIKEEYGYNHFYYSSTDISLGNTLSD